MTDHPVQSVNIQGATARAMALIQKPNAPREVMSVRDATDVDKAMGDPENQHHCPLCNNEFGTAAFAAHAKDCIEKYAPRKKVWLPSGVKGAVQSYSDERPRRPGGGIFGAY